MKRSEMIDKMTAYFFTELKDSDNHAQVYHKMETLLNLMEEDGMAPPIIEVSIECNKGYRNFKRNKWEQE